MPTNPHRTAGTISTTKENENSEAWFERQVEEGLCEADDPTTVWVSNEQVFKEIDERLQNWEDRTDQRKAS